MSQSLFEIESEFEALDDLLFELGGDVTDEQSPHVQEVLRRIAELEGKLHDKADGYAALIATMKARAKARMDEANRLTKRALIDTKSAEYLSSKLKEAMERRGLKKLETRRFKVSVAGNGGLAPLTVSDASLIPAKFFIPQPDKIDNEAIRKAIAAGEEVPGAKLEPRGTHLLIK